MNESAKTGKGPFGFHPLYMQVRDVLVSRLIEGVWKPGTVIPSEMDLARELDVSQGTVRKALDSLTAENLLIRQQGRGTFVAEMEDSAILFQFFRLVGDENGTEKGFPASQVISLTEVEATDLEASRLAMRVGDPVWRIERQRMLDGKPTIVETIFVTKKEFPDLSEHKPLPNNLYRLYSEAYGATIARAEEKLKAINASEDDANLLGCGVGSALLLIERVGSGLDGEPIELRLSRCMTNDIHYANTLK